MSSDDERSYVDEFLATPKNWVVFEQERLAEALGEFVLDRLEAMDISQASLAKCMDKSPAVISRLLSKGSNMTLRTMVELTAAVGYQLEFKLDPIPAAVAGWWLGTEVKPPLPFDASALSEVESAGLSAYDECAFSPADSIVYRETTLLAS